MCLIPIRSFRLIAISSKEWWNWFDAAIVLMWLVEVSLQSFFRLEPAVLRSLAAMKLIHPVEQKDHKVKLEVERGPASIVRIGIRSD